ncbi:transposase [Streptomyces sp. NPDC051644]|uniref:transposase n=1 Tax=Streptomyces sp. NPDC051644 TaxID=3365666 RepID=UPI0037AB5DFA
MDGKSARGSRTGDGPAAHLLAAMMDAGMTVTQLRVPGKTNEIIRFAALLESYDLAGVTVTADALHTQREHARFLAQNKKAHYAFTVNSQFLIGSRVVVGCRAANH